MTLLEGQRWPLSLSPQTSIQTYRLWTVSSASNHQRFMHPEGIRGALTDHEGLEYPKERKKTDSDEKVIKKMCYCFWFFFVFCFSMRPLLQKPPFDAGLWRTPRAQRRVGSLDRRGGRAVCKAQEHFSEVQKPSPEGSRAATLLTFRRGNNISSHDIRPFSVYLSLLAPDVNHDAWLYRLARPRDAPWHFSACWPLHWREARTFSFLFFPLLRPPSAAADSITLCWRARVACWWYGGGADEAWG